MIEVKGRAEGADSVTVTRNEIVTAINSPDNYILALVEIEGGSTRDPRYVHHPFNNEPDFHVYSVNYKLKELMERSCTPS